MKKNEAVKSIPPIYHIPISDISDDDFFKNRISLEGIEELSQSFRVEGQLVPVIVRKVRKGKAKFQIIAGYRRLAAAMAVGFSELLAIVYDRLPDAKAHRISLQENMSRDALTGYEQVNAARRMQMQGLSVAEISEAFGLNERTIQRYLRLSSCSNEVKEALHQGLVSTSQAYEIETLGIPLADVIGKGLSVRQLKAMVAGKKRKSKAAEYIKFRKFKGGNFNLNLKFKEGITDTEDAIAILEEALERLRKKQGETERDR